MTISELSNEQIKQLRREIVLFSLYLNDYENSFDIDPDDVYIFFDGYGDYLSELMTDDGKNDVGNKFFDYLSEYDTGENLLEWFNIVKSA